jgi:REP element-mobilizing transposase RayT
MTTPRAQQIDLSATPYYHVVSRCVRRAFLCGHDDLTGRNFDHRRVWLVERFRFLTDVFAIDCAGFAVMHNHFHLIVRIDADRVNQWSEDEVVRRWGRICTGGAAARYAQDHALSVDDQAEIATKAPLWRQRLCDLSWFMKLLNEFIARRANQEDNCTGHFWESRFKSQALLDERGLLAAMAYVDLNPIRANIAESLVESDYTSIQERIVLHAKTRAPGSPLAVRALAYDAASLPKLFSFAGAASRGNTAGSEQPALPCSLASYIELLEWTGKPSGEGKRGEPDDSVRSILVDLGMTPNAWLHTVHNVRRGFGFAIGAAEALQRWREKLRRRWVKGSGSNLRTPAKEPIY